MTDSTPESGGLWVSISASPVTPGTPPDGKLDLRDESRSTKSTFEMMNKRFFLALLILALVDAFTRGLGPTLSIYLSSGKWDWRMVGSIATLFMIYRSWLYLLGAGLYLLLIEWLPLRKQWYVLAGFLYGLVGFWLYYYIYSFPEFEHRYFRFETRLIQYPLFGAVFGYVCYHLKLRTRSSLVNES